MSTDDALRAAEEQIDNLVQALNTRSVTSAAVGILMERYGLDYDAAFAALARVSSQRNVRLFTLAIELMDTGHVQGLDAP